jgi:membrane-associated phospholipid phosphatase
VYPARYAGYESDRVSAWLIVPVLSVLSGMGAWAGVRHWPRADLAAAAAGAVARELAQSRRVRRFLRSRFDPSLATGLALTAALAGLVVTGAIIGVVVYMVRTNSGVVSMDVRIARWAADSVNGSALRTMSTITWFGSTPVIVVLALAGAVFGIWRYRKPSILLFLTIVVGGQFALMNLIKLTVERARPDIRPSGVFSGSSFPSGHSTAAAATFAALALMLGLWSPADRRALLMGVAVSIAVAVACSRVLLGVHWFSDAIAGLALGWSWFAFCAVAFGGRLLNFGEPAEEVAEVLSETAGDDPLKR